MSANQSPKQIDEAIRGLHSEIEGDVYSDALSRGIYATDASLFQVFPQVVVVPKSESDIVATLRFANEMRLPITARGGATSLSGQTYGNGIVLDVSKWQNRVLDQNVGEKWVRVQGGVVRDHLNAKFASERLHFAPDPATGSRATIGGMIGNNTCGTRSVVYGKTIDHVLECRVMLADGTICTFQDADHEQFIAPKLSEPFAANRAESGTSIASMDEKHAEAARKAQLYKGLHQIIANHRPEILARYPKVLRRVSGYNLDEFVDGAGYTGPIGPRAKHNAGNRIWNLSNLIVGSEGTLGLVLDAKIRLTDLPNATALCVVHYHDLIASLQSVDRILEFQPSTVELLDDTVMREAKVNPATRHMSGFINGTPDAVLIVEFFGTDATEATHRAEAFAERMQRERVGYAWPVLKEKREISNVWETRKLGLGLISNVKGPVKGRDFIEDACVPTEHLADYVRKIRKLCEDHGIQRTSIYAHASVGVVHIVPALDLHEMSEAAKMQSIADQAFEWVMEYGGSWSGEHGDGQLRGQYLPAMFGEQLYSAFREVKHLFDPHNLMNPGKIIDTETMLDNLRYQPPNYNANAARVENKTLFQYDDQGGWKLAIEQCNGVGACRKVNSGVMCPSYMATRDEHHSTRGRANALRLAMSGQIPSEEATIHSAPRNQQGHENAFANHDPIQALASDGLHDCLSLCLSCKACKSECPNSVDMSKMKSEVLQMRYDQTGIPVKAKFFGRMPDAAARLAGRLSAFADLATKLPGGRTVMQRLLNLDSRRPVPSFSRMSLQQMMRREPIVKGPRTRGKVVLFDDTYANYFEPQIGLAAIRLLESVGFEVVVAKAGCCQRTRISSGLIREAKQLGTSTMRSLDHFAAQGLPILCLEPSCASSLKDDLADLMDDRLVAKRVSNSIRMIDQFFEEQSIQLQSRSDSLAIHGHCHQKAMFSTESMTKSLVAGNHEHIQAGCCGMAGSFGYENYELSQKIGEDRLFPAIRNATEQGKTIVACGISCRHQLYDFLQVKAKHWVEVVEPVPKERE